MHAIVFHVKNVDDTVKPQNFINKKRSANESDASMRIQPVILIVCAAADSQFGFMLLNDPLD